MLCKTINDDIHNSYKPRDLPFYTAPRHLNEEKKHHKKRCTTIYGLYRQTQNGLYLSCHKVSEIKKEKKNQNVK